MSASEAATTDPARPPIERRKARAHIGPCQACRSDAAVRVVSRTEYCVYARCARCGTVWSVRKPGLAME